MYTKKDMLRAAKIVREYFLLAPVVGRDVDGIDIVDCATAVSVETAFIAFFNADGNPQFDAGRFIAACRKNTPMEPKK